MYSRQTKQPRWLIILLIPLVILSACSKEETPIFSPHKFLRIVQVCSDPFSDYPYLHRALQTIALWTQQAITVNQDGLHLFADTLSSAADPAKYTFADVSISPFPADPTNPADSGNIYANAQDGAAWQRTLKAQHTELQEEQSRLKPQLDSLRNFTPLPPQIAVNGLAGCLMIAHLRFSHESDPHIQRILIIASYLYQLPAFDRTFLEDAKVVVIDRFCHAAVSCLDEPQWKRTFLSFGAVDAAIYDAAETPSSPF